MKHELFSAFARLILKTQSDVAEDRKGWSMWER